MNDEQAERLRNGTRRAYSTVADRPQAEHPFPVGPHFAESLGYPPELLAGLPAICAKAFAGVSNVAIFADLGLGSMVLDLGCGAGLDTLIAARRVGPRGTVVGVDFSKSMLTRAHQATEQAGAGNVDLYQAEAERLPIGKGEIDVALVNGIFNLNPKREAIFLELARVVRPGGLVYAAELILKAPLPLEIRESETDWFA